MRILRSLLFLVGFAAALPAQNLSTMTRGTATTGINDSAVVMACDSVRPTCRTRAVSGAEFKRFLSRGDVFDSLRTSLFRGTNATLTGALGLANGSAALPSLYFSNSPTTGVYRFGADTMAFAVAGSGTIKVAGNGFRSIFSGSATDVVYGFSGANGHLTGLYLPTTSTIGMATGGGLTLSVSGGAAATLTGGAGDMTIVAGTGNSRTLSLNATNSSGAASSVASFTISGTSAKQMLMQSGGSAASPYLVFNGFNTTGIYAPASDTIGMAQGGNQFLKFGGSSGSSFIGGGAGNMTILAGTGASRTITLQALTSGGVAKNNMVLGADSSATLLSGAQLQWGNSTVAVRGSSTSAIMDFRIQGCNMGRFSNSDFFLGQDCAINGIDFFTVPTGSKTRLLVRADTLDVYSSSVVSQRVTGGASAKWIGGAGNLTIVGGTGASRTVTLRTTNASSTERNTLVLSGDSVQILGPARAGDMSASFPSYSFQNSISSGFYRRGADSVAVSIGGSNTAQWHSGQYVMASGTAAAPSYSFMATGAQDNGLYYATNDTVGVATGGAISFLMAGGSTPALLFNNTAVRFQKNGAALDVYTGSGSGTNYFRFGNGTFNMLNSAAFNMGSGIATMATGSVTAPSTTWGESGTGIYRAGADSLGIAASGHLAAIVRDSQIVAVVGRPLKPTYSFTGHDSTGFYWSTAGTTGLSVSISNSKAWVWNSSGHFQPASDNALDVGNTNQSMRRVYSYTFHGADAASAAAPTFSWDVAGADDGMYVVDATTDTTGLASNGVAFAKGLADTLIIPSFAKITTGMTAASGTPGSLCYNTTTFQVVKNAATSCVVSALRFKDDVKLVSPEYATKSVMNLGAYEWTYKDGGRRALGLVADNADSVDSRLGFRNEDGKINSYDQAGVIALLLATVQQQQRDLAALKAEVKALKEKH